MTMSRRKFLGGVATALTAGAAGCAAARDVTVEEATELSPVFSGLELDSMGPVVQLTATFDPDPSGTYRQCQYDPIMEMNTCRTHSTPAIISQSYVVTPGRDERPADVVRPDASTAMWEFDNTYGDFPEGAYSIHVPLGHSGYAYLTFDIEASSGDSYRIVPETTDTGDTA